MKDCCEIKIKSSSSFIILCVVFFTISCKKNTELSNEKIGMGNYLKKGNNIARNGLLLDSNLQLKLGILDSTLANRIHSLSIIEQKVFWNIIGDMEVGNLDVLYGNFAMISTMTLSHYPFPMVDSLYIFDPNVQEIDSFGTGPSPYIRMPNPHLTNAAHQIKNIDELINAIPIILGYKNPSYNKITYSLGYVPGNNPYFSLVLFENDFFYEELDELYFDPIEVPDAERPQYTLTDVQKANYQSAYDTLPDAIKKLWPWYPYPNRRK